MGPARPRSTTLIEAEEAADGVNLPANSYPSLNL